jgi:hypothetical protein
MRELRCIVFTDREVMGAVLDRRRRLNEPLPMGTVQKLSFESGDTLLTTLHVMDDHGKETSVILSQTEVAAALIAMCMSRKVPMPVDGDKALQLMNGSAALMISMNFKEGRQKPVGKSRPAT